MADTVIFRFLSYFPIYFITNDSKFLDPAIDKVDENVLNLAYNDQQIDVDDDANSIQNHKCCDGIYAGSNYDHRIRESISNYI